MAATGELKERIQLLQAAVARGKATGKALKPELQAELDSYAAQGLLGSSAAGSAGGKVTEGERKTAFLATRLAGSLAQIAAVPEGSEKPSILPALFGGTDTTIGNLLTGADRQRIENAQTDLLDSALTLGTGAAYTKEQLDGYRKAYFPQIGDSASTIADKRKRLDLALEAAKIGAGGAASQIDEALKKVGYGSPGEQAKGGDQTSGTAGAVGGSSVPPAGPSGPDSRGDVTFNDEGPQLAAGVSRLSPEAQENLHRFLLTKPSAQAIKTLYDTLGAGVLPEANAQQIAEYYAKGGTERIGVNYDNARAELTDAEKAEVAGFVNQSDTVGAGVAGIGEGATLSALDEIGSVAEAAFGPGQGSFGERLDRRLLVNRAKLSGLEAESPIAYGAGQVIGSLPLGGAEFAGARAAAAAAGKNAVRANIPAAEARLIANRVFANRTALEAAGFGGVQGFADAEGDIGDRLVGGGVGATVGAAGGYALSRGGSRFARAMAARKGGTSLTPQQEALAAAERQNIVPFPADVGGPMTRRLTSAASQTMAGAGPIRQGAERTLESAEAVRNRVAASIGTPANDEAAGETAIQGSKAFIARTGQKIGRIYDAAAQAGGQARINATEAVRVLDNELGPLRESPIQGPGVAILEGLRDALSKPQTVRGLREARTQLRDQFETTGLRGSNIQRIADRVVDAATDDLVNGLREQGLDRAATQYRVADRLWKQRLEVIDDTLDPIIRNKSGEQVVTALTSAMQGNNRRFETFLKALPPAEQSVVRASLIQRLGRATAGGQDETGEAFSLNTFLSNWTKMGGRAKLALFGPDGKAALSDLATYAAQARESQRYANHSNTGGTVANLSAIWNFTTLGSALIAEGVGTRILASPAVARWLAKAPKQRSPEAIRAHLDGLTRIARSEPAIASDVLALQQHLVDALPALPSRVAADKRRDERTAVQGEARNGATANQRLQP